jgi:thiamine transport system substrate-binding protein
MFLYFFVLIPSGRGADAPVKRTLHLLTYDSLMATGGLGSELVSQFEKRCECSVQVQSVGDAAQILSRLQLESMRGKAQTQIVLGIDQTLWGQLRPMALKWEPKAHFTYSIEAGFIPFDYGVLAWVWNPSWKGFVKENAPAQPPKSWKDLLDSKWKKSLALQDPRTSTPGLGFVLGARSVFGSNAADFFHQLKFQWATLTPGWSTAYGLFSKGEWPLVWSYTTSQAYEQRQNPHSPIRALIFEEGNPVQVEGALLIEKALPDSKDLQLAKEFISYLISPEVQQWIPTRQWMFPAVEGVTLPKEFRALPQPKKSLGLEVPLAGTGSLPSVLKEWESWIR